MKKLLRTNSVVNIGSTGRIAKEIGILAIAIVEKITLHGRNERPGKSELIRIEGNWDVKLSSL